MSHRLGAAGTATTTSTATATVDLHDAARDAFEAAGPLLTSSIVLLDAASAAALRWGYGASAFVRRFRPRAMLDVDAPPEALKAACANPMPLPSAANEQEEDEDGEQTAAGDGWDVDLDGEDNSAHGQRSGGDGTPPAVFVLSGWLMPPLLARCAAQVAVLRACAAQSDFPVRVLCAFSSAQHEAARLPGFAECAAALSPAWSIHHFPAAAHAALLPGLFLFPALSHASFTGRLRGDAAAERSAGAQSADAPPPLHALTALSLAALIPAKGRERSAALAASAEVTAAAHAVPAPAVTLCACIAALLEQLGTSSVELFSLGRLGHEVGRSLSAAAPPRRGQGPAASVLLFDRALDMASLCAHGDAVLDQMARARRRAEAEPSGPPLLCAAFPGAAADDDCALLLRALLHEPLSACLRIAGRLLASAETSALSDVEPSSRKKPKPATDAAQLQQQVQRLRSMPRSAALHHALLALVDALLCAARADEEDDAVDSWRALRSLEGVVLRGLLSSAASPAPSSALLDAVRDVLSSKRRSQLPLASALSLCAFAFASLGPRELPAHEERALRRALLESLSAEDVQQLEEWMAVGGEAGDAQRAERAASGIWAWLERIRYARSALAAPRLADLVEPEEPPTVAPLAARLLSLVLDPARPPLVDLEHHRRAWPSVHGKAAGGAAAAGGGGGGGATVGVGGAGGGSASLSSFLSLGSSVVNAVSASLSSASASASASAAVHPAERRPLLVMMMLGEITAAEIAGLLSTAAAHRHTHQLLIGCTAVLGTAEDALVRALTAR